MTTFTKEQLIEIIKRNITVMDRYPDLVTAQMDLEVYKIALASLEAEPVAYIFKHPAGKLFWALTDESNKEQPDVIPVYADSPASVVPDEIDVNDVPRAVTYFKTHRDCYTDGWNACRAAMLQSGNFRENKNSSTNNFREIAETSTNYPVIPSEVLSAILKVAKIRADFDDFDGDRRGIGDCLDEAEQELIVTINKYASQLAVVPVGLDERAAFNAWNNDENLPIAGVGAKNAAWLAWQVRAELGRSLAVNSPVIPDSWISCSERMPDTKTAVLVAKEFDRKGDWRMKWATYIPGHPDANDGWVIPGASWIPSHWMPLPEPPQEVNQ
ncbi:DUF551 domain-containing protein [Escherichia coli]|nr:DUF551 domain-containing protein [Escherichia coli]EFM7760186.1 DUF551 domain-containing protein [Escherichia coli]EFO2831999.1 DUF551 domain-containing protein [Escherichia coli]EFO2863074.1 DUF551 domain-containing protein [Escherichia coli]EHY3676364.1 DUF551 domain-containing protein [Escherichia coli]